MRRTNIYLDEDQTAALDTIARAAGVSRAELVRRLVDRGVSAAPSDLDADLAAITESFGALVADGPLERGPDERAAHLDRVSRL
ncbi:Ribbon-helix-helix protein, copG family [Geodermatophilus telluris]|uniref:Ribbon-helix-helix protein, copG family n=1 Tax=Geodermatophilus telluris TaxID=1190417 RepID=A0A1G6U1B3_9ACTN|nr:CopG family transcriptional regulator [Geodermatophilus telluris]SDD35170.1 Ribbon-helix-helix protein, copG family [Geodermatophilus telluris]